MTRIRGPSVRRAPPGVKQPHATAPPRAAPRRHRAHSVGWGRSAQVGIELRVPRNHQVLRRPVNDPSSPVLSSPRHVMPHERRSRHGSCARLQDFTTNCAHVSFGRSVLSLEVMETMCYMYIYICINMSVFVYIYIFVCALCVYIHMCVYICVYIYMCIYIYICLCVNIYILIYIYIYHFLGGLLSVRVCVRHDCIPCNRHIQCTGM